MRVNPALNELRWVPVPYRTSSVCWQPSRALAGPLRAAPVSVWCPHPRRRPAPPSSVVRGMRIPPLTASPRRRTTWESGCGRRPLRKSRARPRHPMHLHLPCSRRAAMRLDPLHGLLNPLIGRRATQAGIYAARMALEVSHQGHGPGDAARLNVLPLGLTSCPATELQDQREPGTDTLHF